MTTPSYERLIGFLSSRQAELSIYRDAAERALNRYPDLLDAWRFEEVPASSSPPPDIFLSGVERSDVIIFIAGAEASEATAAEIIYATRLQRDILAFILPVDQRSQQMEKLIGRVREVATTRDVSPDAASFEEEVAEGIRVWLISRVRGRVEAPRLERLRALRAESRERAILKWESAGLTREVAAQLESADDIGAPGFDVLPTASQALVIVTGPAGSGKSLLLERIHQRNIAHAGQSALTPAPIFAKASDVVGSLRDYAEHHIDDLGDLHLTGVALVVDGLDELAEAQATKIEEDAAAFVRAYPHSRLVLSSRHNPPAHLIKYTATIRPLTNVDLQALAERLRGTPIEAWRLLYGLPDSMQEAVARPLFAIAFILRSEPTMSVAQLMDYLIRRCLERAERAHIASELLQNLAVRVLDSDLGLVPTNDIPEADQQTLLQTRLVYERGNHFGFTLRLIAEYAAAAFLARGPIDQAVLRISNPEFADRWQTVLSIYLARLDDTQARMLVDRIATEDPGFAYKFARADGKEASPPWEARALGEAMRDSMRAYGAALDRLMPRRADGGMLNTLSALRDGWLYTGWRDEPHAQEVTTDPPDSMFVPLWLFQRGARFERLRLEANLTAQHVFKWIIDGHIENRGFAIQYGPLFDEELWAVGTALLRRGEFNQEPIPLAELAGRSAQLSGRVRLLTHYTRPIFDADALRLRIRELLEAGQESIGPPLGMRDTDDRGKVWSGYSPAAIVRRRAEVLYHAMRVYQEIVDQWLGRIALRLSRRLLMPALIHEHIQFIQEGEPVSSAYWEPLPEGGRNEVDVALGEPYEMRSIFEAARHALDTRRPQYNGRLGVGLTNGIMSIWGLRPIRDTAYRWLAQDLHAIGWSKHFSLPDNRA